MVQSIISCAYNSAHLLDSLSLTVRSKKDAAKKPAVQHSQNAAEHNPHAYNDKDVQNGTTTPSSPSLPNAILGTLSASDIAGQLACQAREEAAIGGVLPAVRATAQTQSPSKVHHDESPPAESSLHSTTEPDSDQCPPPQVCPETKIQITAPEEETSDRNQSQSAQGDSHLCHEEIQFVFDDNSPSTQHEANGFGPFDNTPMPSFFDPQSRNKTVSMATTPLGLSVHATSKISEVTCSSILSPKSRRQQQFIDDLFVGLRNFGCGDRFKKLHQLGSGASGHVYKVKDRYEKHPITRKSIYYARKMIILDPQNQIKPKIIRAELESLHHCDCPNVIKLHGAYYDNSCVYLLLDYMDCGSLRDVLDLHGSIEEPILAKLVVQLLNGLIYLHEEREIIHRDIKPENILINKEGYVRISDFGMAGLKTSPKGPNGTIYCKSFVGSITYMSPERIQDQKHSFHSDIWSLGLTLAECALGQFPLVGNTGNMYDMWSLLSKKSFQIQFPENVSEDFRDFISICMTFDPRTRPSARELLSHPFIIKNTVYLSNGKVRIKGRKFKSWLKDIMKEGFLERLRQQQQRHG
uniref:mitogen-activated protein kinase kinase n=1 Tax=Percolomonas cosmopolitus TaxID=63605 RepID=A0A7S1PIP0_9EUKA|mmetsp:Transcript_8261/g.30533  ORF Transcript_8261/g.30533 Transcript_8261/m.30533 type:complete len:579 (+) Transcript_8261:284-2020(+)|eukprot:CAMPEP_0117445884 /NCGR_PEP_ID=MMETSP0759-20121206/6039_1 /TAXON_ID=63605 /ORGANISM="Percolomonas cosmopolitus, Strain WS" /LENGTH=578 /DNA_ID=CAMNT_0005238101 /DNA_START=360 /DNA_END=2096 /DNA_ORIENTATION=+